jgi:hypothetical protein
LGDVLVAEGTGKIRQDENHANNAAQAAELDLLLQSEILVDSRGCVTKPSLFPLEALFPDVISI